MPDLRARTKRQALALLAPLRVEMTGRGLVVHQEPAPGTPLDPGTTIYLTLEPTAPTRASAPRAVAKPLADRTPTPGFAGAVDSWGPKTPSEP
jgi:hypothetical protein